MSTLRSKVTDPRRRVDCKKKKEKKEKKEKRKKKRNMERKETHTHTHVHTSTHIKSLKKGSSRAHTYTYTRTHMPLMRTQCPSVARRRGSSLRFRREEKNGKYGKFFFVKRTVVQYERLLLGVDSESF